MGWTGTGAQPATLHEYPSAAPRSGGTASLLREDPDHPFSSPDLLVDPLDGIGRAQPSADIHGQAQDLCHIVKGLLQESAGFGSGFPVFGEDAVPDGTGCLMVYGFISVTP